MCHRIRRLNHLSRTRFAATVVRFQGAISGLGISIHHIVGIVVWSSAGDSMVVEHKGFRSRWIGNSSAAPDSSLPPVDSGGPTSDNDGSWEPVQAPDTEDLFGNNDDASFDASEFHDHLPSCEPVFMNPKPKSVATKPTTLSDESMSIKRTADEMASRHVHKLTADLKQPWQRGPLANLFTRPKPFWERFQVSQALPLVGLSDHVTASSSDNLVPKQIQQTELTVQRIKSSRLVSSCDNFRHVALARFKTMVLLDLECTRLGQSLRSFAGTLCSDGELSQVFMDVFSPKATGTILKRCNALWRFSCWIQNHGGGSPLRQDEKVVYAYICHLRDSGAGSTTPSQFVEALRFADALIGFTAAPLNDILSPRVTGAAHACYMTKRFRKPAELLKVAEIAALEDICLHDQEDHRRLIAGHLIFCFAAAARWHDSMYVVSLELSTAGPVTLLEAMTSKHKSSRGKEQQMELLPFTALGHVTHDESWGSSWVDAREASDARSWNHFLNSWSESEKTWIDSRMSTAEATAWLRELLEPHVGSDRASTLTVHGMKATLLSWAAKSTMFTADEQLALGHHVNAQYRSAMIYSRDNQIGLCKKIHLMFCRIRDGSFDPDATRVSRLFQLAFDTALERDGGSSDSSSSTSDDASSVASSNGEHAVLAQKTTFRRLDADDIEADKCLINRCSKVIHLLASEDERFWCGRSPSASFDRASRDDLATPEAVVCASCSHAYRASKRDP